MPGEIVRPGKEVFESAYRCDNLTCLDGTVGERFEVHTFDPDRGRYERKFFCINCTKEVERRIHGTLGRTCTV